MKPQSADTDTCAEQVQISLLREKSAAEKFALVRSMTSFAIQLSHRAILRANEGITEQEAKVLFIKLHYGRELAERVKPYLVKDDNACSADSNCNAP